MTTDCFSTTTVNWKSTLTLDLYVITYSILLYIFFAQCRKKTSYVQFKQEALNGKNISLKKAVYLVQTLATIWELFFTQIQSFVHNIQSHYYTQKTNNKTLILLTQLDWSFSYNYITKPSRYTFFQHSIKLAHNDNFWSGQWSIFNFI